MTVQQSNFRVDKQATGQFSAKPFGYPFAKNKRAANPAHKPDTICSTFIFAQPHKDHHRFDYICNQMTAKFKYLLFIVVSFCYLQSALEVNTDTIKNTWGDEYDTYIHADNTASQHIIKIEHRSNFALLPDFFLSKFRN